MQERTKAQTLQYLKLHMKNLNILPMIIIKWSEYCEDKGKTLCHIRKTFCESPLLIIRSSSAREDKEEFSYAGGFLSVANVPSNSETEIKQAIENVYDSYNTAEDEEILIQPMLQDVTMSGVVMTRDIYLNTPYYTVNYSLSEDTAAVTGGMEDSVKTLIIYREKVQLVEDSQLKELLHICCSIERFIRKDSLDIEFAVDKQQRIYILQVRPIAKGNKVAANYDKLDNALNKLYKKIEKLMRESPFLLGKTTCFGVMPDWNPAEILGLRPQKLAISLYKELITDQIWAHQRSNYGYRDLTMQPLMASFCGVPYIDTRVTFNSFIPKTLSDKLAEKLTNYYTDRLQAYPAYHDKIEFEIVFSCYYLGVSEKLEVLLEHGFNRNEIKRIEFALLNLTNNVIHPRHGLYKQDIAQADILTKKYEQIINSDMSIVDQIYWLIEQCKTYGTLPFAGVARAGFIAVQFLKSFVSKGLISSEEQETFMSSLNTVSRQLQKDRARLKNGTLCRDQFLKQYGHIRPGTYDILSPRYDEAFETYFQQEPSAQYTPYSENTYYFNTKTMQQLENELDENGILITADELLQFIKESIEGRESVKFIFTKCVSKVLQLITELGERNHIGKEDMAHLDIDVIKQLYVDLYYDNLSDVLKSNINKNKEQYCCARIMKLPSLICRPEDVYCYYQLEDEPNFITLKSVTAQIVEEEDILKEKLEGKAVFIRSADPGYDFLFTKKIGALITQFGGANSHMSIRCAELNIPAVIGAGERNYEKWRKYQKISIDCGNRKVEPYERT